MSSDWRIWTRLWLTLQKNVRSSLLPHSSLPADIIACSAITQAAAKSLRDVRGRLSEICVKSLLAYRKHCASSTSPAQVSSLRALAAVPTLIMSTQLILPESFKLFPLYALALMKSKALKGTVSSLSSCRRIADVESTIGGPVASDVRTWQMRLIKSAGVAATVGLLYPRMLPVHTFAEDIGFRAENGRIKLPPLMRISYARMEPHGAYLIGASSHCLAASRVLLTRLSSNRKRRNRHPLVRIRRLASDSTRSLRGGESRRTGHPHGVASGTTDSTLDSTEECSLVLCDSARWKEAAGVDCAAEHRWNRGGILKHAGGGCE